MNRWCVGAIAIILIVYLCFGFYVVRGNEKAAVRRFGKALRTETGSVTLKPSGLYFDLPWPFTRIDRVNVNEIRTLTVGTAEVDDVESGQFLQAVDATQQSQFLSGDKNILNVQFSVHYRIDEMNVDAWLYGTQNSERRLRLLSESALSDLMLQSGVDFVHTLGRTQLREMLLRRTRELASENQLGLEVEDVTIGSVYPPIRVKAQFLDVMNARADRETYINQANNYAEQRKAEATAAKRKINDEAETYRQRNVEIAKAKAHSFVKMVESFHRDEQEGIQSYAAARHMAMQRLYIEAMKDILQKVAGKVFLDSGKPVDLTIFRDPRE